VADYPHPSSAGRSANMRAIRRTGTKPEMALRRALHGRGYRYRKDYRLDLANGKRVRPDIAFTARKVAVFVDGCFWHACPEHGKRPSANTWYWDPKLQRNVERDQAANAALAEAGWTVVRIWEHEALDSAVTSVISALDGRPARTGRATGPVPELPSPRPQPAQEQKTKETSMVNGNLTGSTDAPPVPSSA
jgi:DNA mismatch endonuclease (patch repair protein)